MNKPDKYEKGFELAGFYDVFWLFGFLLLDVYLIMDDQIKVEKILGALLFGY